MRCENWGNLKVSHPEPNSLCGLMAVLLAGELTATQANASNGDIHMANQVTIPNYPKLAAPLGLDFAADPDCVNKPLSARSYSARVAPNGDDHIVDIEVLEDGGWFSFSMAEGHSLANVALAALECAQERAEMEQRLAAN